MAVGIFVAVTLLFFAPHLFGGKHLWEDFTEQTFPFEAFAARNFMAGIVPFWNPFSFNGMPFLADIQNGFFYPGNMLMYILSGGKLSAWLLQFFVIVHYLVAMIGMWKLARALGIGSWGAVFSGIAYSLCGMMVVHMIHANVVEHLAWFPLITYLFYRGLTERSLRHALLAGLTLGVAMLVGHPQSALYIVLFLFALTIFVMVRDLRSGDDGARGSLARALAMAALPVAIGAGIFAVQLLPSQELAGLSERAEMSYAKSLDGELGTGQLLTFVVPKFFGTAGPGTEVSLPFWYRAERYYYWETAVYIGVVTLLLAAVGLASRRLGGLGWFLAGMSALGVAFALGDNFFVHPIIARLPLFDKFRIPTRMAIFASFGGALLAGVGLERVVRGREGEGRMVNGMLAVGGVIVLIGLLTVSGVLGGIMNAPKELIADVGPTGLTALLLGGIATLVAFLSMKGRIPATAAAALLLVAGITDVFLFGAGQNSSTDNPEQIYKANDAEFAAFKASSPDKLFRVKMREQGAMLMQRNQGPYSGIMLYEGYNPLLLQRRVPPAPTQEASFDLLNIAYDVRVDSTNGRASLMERTTRYPHARMLYDVKIATESTSAETMKGGSVDLGRTVVLEEDPGIRTDGSGTGKATITRYDADEIGVNVTTDKPGILLLSEIWYPCWDVTIDGAPAKLLRADYSLRGVAVPAGTHTVAMRFHSPAFAQGMWITLATLLLTLGGLVFTIVKHRRAGTAVSSGGVGSGGGTSA